MHMTAIKHPMKIVAEQSLSPKAAARESGGLVTVNQVRAIRDLRAKRADARRWTDPLINASISRKRRTPTALAERQAIEDARRAGRAAELQRIRADREHEEGIRKALIAAARLARALGFSVRSSKDCKGRVSSYYLSRPGKAGSIRISDHDLPWSPKRDFMAREHGRGGFDGFHGRQLVINQPRRAEWLRRALVLIEAGRM